MFKIQTKLVVYCLAYFLPVRMPEIGLTLRFTKKISYDPIAVRYGTINSCPPRWTPRPLERNLPLRREHIDKKGKMN